MGSKLSTWKWASRISNDAFVAGTIAMNNQLLAPGQIANLYITTTDTFGSSRLEDLKSIGQDALVLLDSLPPADDANMNLQLRVSGEPSFSISPVPHYNFPVTLVSAIGGAGANWDLAIGSLVDIHTPVGALGTSLVSVDESYFTGSKDISEFTSKNTRWDTREGDIRKRIYKMTTAKNSISFIYKELLRSMIASFNDLGYINSEDNFVDVQCIHANAERAVAKLKQENNIILPIVSVAQTTSDNDATRRRNESVLVHEKHWDHDRQRAFRVLSLAPRPVNVKYQLHIWTKYLADMDQLVEQVRLKFNPEMQVPTRFSTLTKAHIESEDDVGPPIAGDKDDRIIQKTISIVVRTYVPSPKFLVTATGQIEEFKVEVH